MALELGRVTDRKPPFKYSSLTRVGFSDTDAQGIVYYGRYLPYFDSARVEYHRHLELLVTEPRENEFVMAAKTSCSGSWTWCTTRSSITPGSASTSSRATTSCWARGEGRRRPSTFAS